MVVDGEQDRIGLKSCILCGYFCFERVVDISDFSPLFTLSRVEKEWEDVDEGENGEWRGILELDNNIYWCLN